MKHVVLLSILFVACASSAPQASVPGPTLNAEHAKDMTNSIGMRLLWIEPGAFTMGFSGEPIPAAIALAPWRAGGDFDERPAHRVRISKGLYMGAFEVTNTQYEQFDPAHRSLRGKLGFSKEDNEAVVFVSWQDANRFCQWLSKKEGKTYRFSRGIPQIDNPHSRHRSASRTIRVKIP